MILKSYYMRLIKNLIIFGSEDVVNSIQKLVNLVLISSLMVHGASIDGRIINEFQQQS